MVKPAREGHRMKIGRIESFHLRYTDTNDFSNRRETVLVRVETVDGVVGWGEGIAMWPEACKAVCAIVDDGLKPLLLGAGELTVEEAWTAMRKHCWWYGEGGLACFAYSAIDMALWDIEGKIQKKPLYELFGGKRHESLPAYAANHVNKATLEENVAEVVDFHRQGYRGVKLGFGKRGLSDVGRNPEGDVHFVRALREALGPDFEIIVDVGNGVVWDRDTAIRTVRAMAEYDIGWIEEPFYPTQIDDYRALKAAVSVPIASGEREWTVTGYSRLIDTGTVDVIGCDPARAEGITGFRKIDALCGAAGIIMNAHAWSSAILSAASLHLSIASPNTRLLEFKPFPNALLRDLVDAPIVQRNGVAQPSDRPGLGVDVDEAVVARLAGEHWESK